MQLFTREQAPRTRKPIKRMHVHDCGPSPYKSESGKEAHFVWLKCGHCKHDNDWMHFEGTITELKKGLPCPKCNPSE